MSLNWELGAIKDWETVCKIDGTDDDGKPARVRNPVTTALIWQTMAVGMGKITEANAVEFYTRVHIGERLHGASLQAWPKGDGPSVDRYMTLAEVRAHIGLTTNVSMEPRGKWLARVYENLERDVRYREQRAAEAQRPAVEFEPDAG